MTSCRVLKVRLVLPLALAVAAGAVAVPAAATAGKATGTTAAGWPQYGYGAGLTSDNTGETTLGPGNVHKLKLAWSAPDLKIKGEPVCCGATQPTVAGGIVYLGTSWGVFARNATTGKLLWQAALGGDNRDRSSKSDARYTVPAVANGIVYAGSGTAGPSYGQLTALNARTGKKLWTYVPGVTPRSPYSMPVDSPNVAGGVVWDYIGNHLYELNARTGKLIWSHHELQLPAVAGGAAYATGYGRLVFDIDIAIQRYKWVYKAPVDTNPQNAVTAGGAVYVLDYTHLLAVSAATGRELWDFRVPVTQGRSRETHLAVANGVVYFAAGNDSGPSYLYAVRAGTGTQLWRLRFGKSGRDQQYAFGNPELANGVLYITTDNVNGKRVKLEALSARSGKLLWSVSHNFQDPDDPAVADGKLYVGLTTGMDAYSLP
jgi:outer membrane protein assembly factor BamB